MKIEEWKPRPSGALLGYLTITTNSGMTIAGVAVFKQAGSRWTALPKRPRLSGGKAKKSTTGGWVSDPVVEIKNRERKDLFDKVVLAALDSHLSRCHT